MTVNAKNVIRAAHNVLLALTPEKVRYVLLENACRKYGVSSVVMDSHLGSFEGALQDEGMFRLIMKSRDPWWSEVLTAEVATHLAANERGTYIDIGANIGTTTIRFARNAPPSWSFLAFEPGPENFIRLRTNLIRNGLDERVQVFNLALADKPGSMAFVHDPTNFGDSRLSITEDEGHKVKVETLDRIVAGKEIANPIVVKIDAQGAEPLILKGGHDLFMRSSLVIMEFWPYGIQRLGGDASAFLQELRELFAGFVAIEKNHIRLPHDKSEVRIQSVIAARSHESFDLILTQPQ
jgi:FkbM family methyltransferase